MITGRNADIVKRVFTAPWLIAVMLMENCEVSKRLIETRAHNPGQFFPDTRSYKRPNNPIRPVIPAGSCSYITYSTTDIIQVIDLRPLRTHRPSLRHRGAIHLRTHRPSLRHCGAIVVGLHGVALSTRPTGSYPRTLFRIKHSPGGVPEPV